MHRTDSTPSPDDKRSLQPDPATRPLPPEAFAKPVEDQRTNNPAENKTDSSPADDPENAAYHFGWQSYLQFGRAPSTGTPISFESLESDLERQWEERQRSAQRNQPWKEAREMAKAAWDKVRDAMAGE